MNNTSHTTDEMECECLKNIIDQNINTDEETNPCQLIKHNYILLRR